MNNQQNEEIEYVEVEAPAPIPQPFLKRRAQMAIVGVGLWLLLALWTLSAFWQHIDELGSTYAFAAKLGACAGEFAALALVLWHCFDKHLGVRRWSLIFVFLLAVFLLSHSGALRGMHEATTAQVDTEKRMAAVLTEMSTKQAGAITGSAVGTQRERMANEKVAKTQQAEIAKNAQKEVAANIAASVDKVKSESIFPLWYLNGWMYSVIFIFSLLLVSIIFLLMMRDDIDANFDGILDSQQGRQRTQAASPIVSHPIGYAPPVTSRQSSTTITGGGSNFTPLP